MRFAWHVETLWSEPATGAPDVELLDPDSPVSRDRWWRFRVEVDGYDLPYDPPLTRPHTTWWLYPEPGTRTETWVVRDSNGIAASLNLQLFDDHNRHLAWGRLHVRPDARRRGLGSALYAHALERARAEGRRTLNIGGPRSDAAAEFADAMSAEHVQTLLRSVQRLDQIDLRRLSRLVERAQAAAPHYSLVRWTARCPDDLLDAYVSAKAGMLDAPVSDGLDFEPPRARPDALRGCEELHRRLGVKEYVICARHTTTGELVGTTQVCAVGGVRADQGDTTVLRAHRGHRLGFLLKASMALWFAEQEPEVREIQTWNDPDNEPMLRVNRQLLYRPSELWDDWSKPVS